MKALSVKYLRALLTTTACLSHNNKHKPQISKSMRSKWVYIYLTLSVLVRNYGVKSNFNIGNTLCKLLCKPKYRATKKGKNNIVYDIHCSNCEAVYLNGESKRSLKSSSGEHKRSVKNFNCEKNKIVKHCCDTDHNFSWDQKKVVGIESRPIPRNIKETIHSFINPNLSFLHAFWNMAS